MKTTFANRFASLAAVSTIALLQAHQRQRRAQDGRADLQ